MFRERAGRYPQIMRRSSEQGSAMLVTLIIITALMAGAAALTSMQLASSRGAELNRASNSAVHCAEAGIATALATVSTSYPQWNAALAAGTEPAWLASLDHDLDNDGASDFTLTLRDNDDEAVTSNDPTKDNDLAVFVVATCTKYPDIPMRIAQLVRYSGGGTCYQSQLGGCGGNNNSN